MKGVEATFAWSVSSVHGIFFLGGGSKQGIGARDSFALEGEQEVQVL
jgi:hypothetical protein